MRMDGWWVALAGLAASASAGAGEIRWTESYADAKKAAAERDSLMMIDFYTDW